MGIANWRLGTGEGSPRGALNLSAVQIAEKGGTWGGRQTGLYLTANQTLCPAPFNAAHPHRR